MWMSTDSFSHLLLAVRMVTSNATSLSSGHTKPPLSALRRGTSHLPNTGSPTKRFWSTNESEKWKSSVWNCSCSLRTMGMFDFPLVFYLVLRLFFIPTSFSSFMSLTNFPVFLSNRLEETEIEDKVAALREELLENLASLATSAKNLKSSDTHAIAAAKKTELDKMARALGTRRDYAEGEAFDREKQEENKRIRLVEREERDKKRGEERARMQEQRQRWEAEKRERERMRRREEDRMRREREADEEKRRERMPPPPVPPHRERAGRDSYRRAFSPRRRQAAYELTRTRSRSQSRSRSPDPARRRRPRSPPYSRRRSPPPRRALQRSVSPPRRRSHSPSPRRDRGRYDSPPPQRGRDRSESPVRDDRSPPPRSDDSREERRGRQLSVSPKPSRAHARSRSGSAGSSMSVSTNDSRSSGRSD